MSKRKGKVRDDCPPELRMDAAEMEELRSRNPEEFLRRFFAMMKLAKEMNWQEHTPEEIEQVRQRWKKLKGPKMGSRPDRMRGKAKTPRDSQRKVT